jgi:hypothetical protein
MLQTKRADGVLATPPPALTPGKESTMPKATLVYSLSSIFRKAWAIARHLAKHGRDSVRTYFAAALRQSWADAKALAQRTAESNARVQAEIERIKALHTREAAAVRAAEMAAFQTKFFPARRSYGYRRAA